MNKEQVYQSIIGVLILALGLTFYQLYSGTSLSNTLQEESHAIEYINVRDQKERNDHQGIKSLDRPKRDFNKESLQESIKENLARIQANYKQELNKSMDIIKEYNRNNPDNPIEFDEDEFQWEDSSLDHSSLAPYPQTEINPTQDQRNTLDPSSLTIPSQEYGSYTTSGKSSSGQTPSLDQSDTDLDTDTSSEQTSDVPSSSSQPSEYEKEINDIQDMMNTIRSNMQ